MLEMKQSTVYNMSGNSRYVLDEERCVGVMDDKVIVTLSETSQTDNRRIEFSELNKIV